MIKFFTKFVCFPYWSPDTTICEDMYPVSWPMYSAISRNWDLRKNNFQ